MAKIKACFGFLIVAMFAIGCVRSTCVFESDFGFKLNCAFKKSGLFRVRNLGGVKAHLGLGFSVGDELGFDQSLTNLDTSKRRSVSVVNGAPVNNVGVATQQQKLRLNVRNNNNRITVRQPTSAPTTLDVPLPTEKMVESGRAHGYNTRQNFATLPPFRPIPPAKDMMVPKPPKSSDPNIQSNPNRMGQTANANYVSISASPVKIVGIGQAMTGNKNEAFRQIPSPMMQSYSPGPISRVASIEDYQNKNGVSIVTSQAYKNSVQVPLAPNMMTKIPMGNTLSLHRQTQGPIYNSGQKIDNMVAYNVINGQNYNEYSTQSSLHQKIAALSKATNISVETIEAAVRLRQNQILQQMLNVPPSTTTTTTTTPKPFLPTIPPKRYHPPPPVSANPPSKVMNAPKEYYPVGYDKNFDDNFLSKVDLPDTSFYCGDQKHFPGLYADEDLGCMVFHVCALTDDGLIMKSFLCPESTLFDQTILKCNWWFYVDCKNSKKLYDSNIPISKSYQLMKALTFFSSYKKEIQGDDQHASGTRSVIEENTNGVSNAVKILQNQGGMQLPRVEIVELNKTNHHKFDRNSKFFPPINIKEVNALSEESASYVTPVPVDNKDSRINRGRKAIESSEVVTSTQKSTTEKSIQRQYRRRPSVSWKVISTTTEVPTEDTNHRSERSSAEVTESPKPVETTTIKTTTTTMPITTTKTTTTIKLTTMVPRVFVMPEIKEDTKVSKTIKMMDQAIMGQNNSS